MLKGVTSFGSYTQVIRRYSPQSGRTARTLIFLLQVPGMTLYYICNSSFAWLGRRYKGLVGIIYFVFMHKSFVTTAPPPQAQGNAKDFVSAVPHSNHHTVGTASWQSHDRSPPAVCYYTALPWLHMSPNTYISFA